MNSKKNKYNKDTTLEEVLKHPQGEEILGEMKIPCLSCPMAQMEMSRLTLGQICEQYDINLKELLSKLNKNK